jgi:hypothetical protein
MHVMNAASHVTKPMVFLLVVGLVIFIASNTYFSSLSMLNSFKIIQEPVCPPNTTCPPNITIDDAATVLKESLNPDKDFRSNYFYSVATSFDPTTDKVTTHAYHRIYGTFLLPFYEAKPNMKFLEIGLGCDMGYGPGASVKLWKQLFPKAELWEGEFNAECVEKSKQNGQLDGIHTLTGDQETNAVLDQWIEQSNGGHFDIIIDDGGHHNCQIYNSFMKLWPVLNPHGFYFIEDLQASKWEGYSTDVDTRCNGAIMVHVVKDWIEQLMDGPNKVSSKYPLPTQTAFVHCQEEMCVIAKL